MSQYIIDGEINEFVLAPQDAVQLSADRDISLEWAERAVKLGFGNYALLDALTGDAMFRTGRYMTPEQAIEWKEQQD